jgi:hypothetical protein
VPFELFTDKGRRRARSAWPYLTVTRNGDFTFDRASWESIGSPEHVEIIYDRDARVIGVRATASEDGYKVRPNGVKACLINARVFCRYLEIDHSVARRRPVHCQDRALYVFLDDERTLEVGRGRPSIAV